jgi:hypothetical protein
MIEELLQVRIMSSTYTSRKVILWPCLNKKREGSDVEDLKLIYSNVSLSLWYHALGD